MYRKNNRLHSGPRWLSLATQLDTCRGTCPKKVLPSGGTTSCFYSHESHQAFRPRRSTFPDCSLYDRKLHVSRTNPEEERRLIEHAYRVTGERGLLIKTLLQTGARVSEFVHIRVEDVFFEEQMILLEKAKGGKSRYVPILPELAQELRTHLRGRTTGYLFETMRHTRYSPRRIQQLVKETAAQAKITKRVYPHLLRHSVAMTLLERGMPLEQIQKFLGHAKLDTTQVYAESTAEMIKASYQKALAK